MICRICCSALQGNVVLKCEMIWSENLSVKVHVSAAAAATAAATAAQTMTNYLTFSATATEICSLHGSLPVFNVLEAQSAVNDGLETQEW